MPLPTFTEIQAKDPRFQSLDPKEKEAFTERYWNKYAQENPDDVEYIDAQRKDSLEYLRGQSRLDDAAPVERRLLEDTLDDRKFNLVARDGLKRGLITQETLPEIQAKREQKVADRKDVANRNREIFSGSTAVTDTFQGLLEPAKSSGLFGSRPFGEFVTTPFTGRTEQDQKDAYQRLRNAVAKRYALEPDEVDDVVRHQLGEQERPVSRDVLGRIYIKNELFTKGFKEVKKSVEKSTLPWSVKSKELEGLEEKYNGFQEEVVVNVLNNHKEYAAELGLDAKSSPDENFKKITESLTTNKYEQALSSGVSAIRPSLITVAETAGKQADDPLGIKKIGQLFGAEPSEKKEKSIIEKSVGILERRQKLFASQQAISEEFNSDKLKFFNDSPLEVSASVIGQGLGSVAESVVIARATGKLIPKIGGASKLAESLNKIRGVAPTAAILGTRTGVQGYEDAIAQGFSEAEAFQMGLTKGIVEAGTTLAFTASGARSIEEIAAGMKKAIVPSVKSAFGAATKDLVLGTGSEIGEESIINAVTQAVDSITITPGMTVDDFVKSSKETALASLVPAGGVGLVGSVDTYKRTTAQIKAQANANIPEEVLQEIEPVAPDTPDLTAERDTLVQQIETLPPESEDRIALEERLAEVDEELGVETPDPVVQDVVNEPDIQRSTSEQAQTELPLSVREVSDGEAGPLNTEPDVVAPQDVEPTQEAQAQIDSDLTAAPEVTQEVTEETATIDDVDGLRPFPELQAKYREQTGGNSLAEVQILAANKREGLSDQAAIDATIAHFKKGKDSLNLASQVPSAVNEKKPFSVEAFEEYGLSIPDGYVKQGELYVYQPSSQQSPAQAGKPTDTLPEGQTSPEGRGEVAAVSPEVPISPNRETPIISESVAEQQQSPPPPRNESPDAEPQPDIVGISKKLNTQYRRDYGLTEDPTIRIEGETKQAIIEADEEIKANPELVTNTVDSLDESGRGATVKETAILSYALTKAKKNLDAAIKNSNDTPTKANLVREDEARAEFNKISKVIINQGRAKSLALNAQKMLRRTDYSYEGMYSRALAAKRKSAEKPDKVTIPKEEDTEIREKAKKIEMSDKELAAAISEAYQEGRMDAEREAALEAKRDVRGKKKTTAEKQAEKKAYNEKRLAEARKKIRASRGQLSAGIDPTLIPEYVVVVTDYIRRGFNKLGDIKNKLIKDFGKGADAYAEAVYDEALALANEGLPKTPAQLVAEMDASKPINRRSVGLIVRQYYAEDITLTPDQVVTKLQNELKAKWSQVTRNEVSDAWTGYGQESTTPQTRSELLDAEAKGKRAAKLTREIKALKDGTYKDKRKSKKDVDEDITELTKERNRLLRDAKISVPKDPLIAAKTRLKRDVEALEKAVANNELIQKKDRTTQTDAELEALKARRDEAKALYEEAFPNQDVKINARERKLLDLIEAVRKNEMLPPKERSPKVEDDLSKQLAQAKADYNEHFKTLGPAKPTAKERALMDLLIAVEKNQPIIKDKKTPKEKTEIDKQLAEARKQYEEQFPLVDRPETSPAQEIDRVLKALDKQIKRLEENKPTVRKEISAWSSDIADKRKRLKELRDAKKKSPEDKLVEAINRNTAAYKKRIKDGDFSKEKKNPMKTKKVDDARYENDLVKAEFDRYAAELMLKSASPSQRAIHKLKGLGEFRKLFILGLDIMFFRQGIWSFATRPINTTKNLIRAIANASEKSSQILYNDLTNPEVSPNAREYNQIKSFRLFSPLDVGFRNKEDLPDFEVLEKIEKLPFVGGLASFIKAVERTNRNLHNLIATDTYNTVSAALRAGKEDGITKDQAALASNAAMKMVGRGDSKYQKLESAIPILNAGLLSTRYYMARFASVIGSPVWSGRAAYTKENTRIRYEIAKKMYGKLLFNMAVVMGTIYNLMDDDDEKRNFIDPTSPTFGKFRVGGSEYELINSFRPFINIIAKTALGYTYRDGKELPLRGEGSNRFRQSLKEEWENFFWNRRNINFAYVTDVINGHFYGGEPITWGNLAKNLMGNINIRNDWEIINEEGEAAAQKAIDILLIHLGLGVENDPDKFNREKKTPSTVLPY